VARDNSPLLRTRTQSNRFDTTNNTSLSNGQTTFLKKQISIEGLFSVAIS